MKASSLVLTVGMIFFAVLNFTNPASGPKPTINKLSKGMTFHPFTQLNINKADRSKLDHQATMNIPDHFTDRKNHSKNTPETRQPAKKSGKQLSSRVK